MVSVLKKKNPWAASSGKRMLSKQGDCPERGGGGLHTLIAAPHL